MTAEPRTWEEVLAAVEQDARRAAAMLRPEAGQAGPEPFMAPAVLPPPEQMPEVAPQLRERIEHLRDQIDSLSAELADVLRDWPVATPVRAARWFPLAVATASAEPSRYVDRRV